VKKFSVLLLFWGIFSFAQTASLEVITAQDSVSVIQNPSPGKSERGEIFYQKRNFREDFKENYRGKEFDYDRKVKPPKTIKPPLFQLPAGLMSVLMYAILAIIIVFILYQIFKNAGGFSFGKEKAKIKFDASEENPETENMDDISNNNFPNLIEKAKSEADYRKAIRFYYLWVLQKLSDKNLINWNKDKTDYDYFLELKNHSIKEDFSVNTYIYDYTWYGNLNPDKSQFDLAETIFMRTLNKLN
jgi:hypothetical protein